MSHCSPELEAPPHFSFCTNTVVAGVRRIPNVVMMIFAVIAAVYGNCAPQLGTSAGTMDAPLNAFLHRPVMRERKRCR